MLNELEHSRQWFNILIPRSPTVGYSASVHCRSDRSRMHDYPWSYRHWNKRRNVLSDSYRCLVDLVPNSTTRTPATDTTNGRAHITILQQIHHQRTKICHLQCSGIAMWQICCRIVVSSSVGGVLQLTTCP